MDPEYKRLIRWLITFIPDEAGTDKNAAYLMVSNKLIAEYQKTSGPIVSKTNIVAIIQQMTREGRLIRVTNEEIKRKYFVKNKTQNNKIQNNKTQNKNFRSNKADQDHIPVVLLSERKYALSLDKRFVYDLTHFPGFEVLVARRPEDLPYDR